MNDDWGHDASVRFMRRVFKGMEETQKRLLANLAISRFDARLRHWRETTRDLFEQVWPIAAGRGTAASEEKASILYAHCLARTLTSGGIKIPNGVVSHDEKISKLVEEVKP